VRTVVPQRTSVTLFLRDGAGGGGDLVAEDLALSFGGVRAVSGVGFAARRGVITSVIGPNGAGKTTLLIERGTEVAYPVPV
jgi:ATPase subunit of ABC transporter with duplicated ATPase domains